MVLLSAEANPVKRVEPWGGSGQAEATIEFAQQFGSVRIRGSKQPPPNVTFVLIRTNIYVSTVAMCCDQVRCQLAVAIQ
jgi:hypothetical protein